MDELLFASERDFEGLKFESCGSHEFQKHREEERSELDSGTFGL